MTLPCRNIFHYHPPTNVTKPLYEKSEEYFIKLISMNPAGKEFAVFTDLCKEYYEFIISSHYDKANANTANAVESLLLARMIWNDIACGNVYFKQDDFLKEIRKARFWCNASITLANCKGECNAK